MNHNQRNKCTDAYVFYTSQQRRYRQQILTYYRTSIFTLIEKVGGLGHCIDCNGIGVYFHTIKKQSSEKALIEGHVKCHCIGKIK